MAVAAMQADTRRAVALRRTRAIGLASLGAFLLGAAATPAGTDPAPAPAEQDAPALKVRPDLGKPYIGGPLPDAIMLVPPPPGRGSATHARDLAASAEAIAMIGTARWKQARRDADLAPGALPRNFSCAAGVVLSDTATPAIVHLLRRAGADLGWSTSEVKDHYGRPRPFMENGKASCTPEDEPFLRTNGAYPSGHSAIGYGTGLILASIFPGRAAAIVGRGRDFGDSRRVCNVHWQSDVEAGRDIAAATFARLTANSEFARDLAAARTEAAALPEAVLHPEGCAVEAAALGGN